MLVLRRCWHLDVMGAWGRVGTERQFGVKRYGMADSAPSCGACGHTNVGTAAICNRADARKNASCGLGALALKISLSYLYCTTQNGGGPS